MACLDGFHWDKHVIGARNSRLLVSTIISGEVWPSDGKNRGWNSTVFAEFGASPNRMVQHLRLPVWRHETGFAVQVFTSWTSLWSVWKPIIFPHFLQPNNPFVPSSIPSLHDRKLHTPFIPSLHCTNIKHDLNIYTLRCHDDTAGKSAKIRGISRPWSWFPKVIWCKLDIIIYIYVALFSRPKHNHSSPFIISIHGYGGYGYPSSHYYPWFSQLPSGYLT